jgi:hypothetical protein
VKERIRSFWRWLTSGKPGASIPPVDQVDWTDCRPIQYPFSGDKTQPIEGLVRLSDMTREQWAKYNWNCYGAYWQDPDPGNPIMIRSTLRTPSAAQKAWDEFETFQKLHEDKAS